MVASDRSGEPTPGEKGDSLGELVQKCLATCAPACAPPTAAVDALLDLRGRATIPGTCQPELQFERQFCSAPAVGVGGVAPEAAPEAAARVAGTGAGGGGKPVQQGERWRESPMPPQANSAWTGAALTPDLPLSFPPATACVACAVCAVCGERAPSRNLLFRHLREKHAFDTPSQPVRAERVALAVGYVVARGSQSRHPSVSGGEGGGGEGGGGEGGGEGGRDGGGKVGDGESDGGGEEKRDGGGGVLDGIARQLWCAIEEAARDGKHAQRRFDQPPPTFSAAVRTEDVHVTVLRT